MRWKYVNRFHGPKRAAATTGVFFFRRSTVKAILSFRYVAGLYGNVYNCSLSLLR
jgi:hypothetical protein